MQMIVFVLNYFFTDIAIHVKICKICKICKNMQNMQKYAKYANMNN